MTARENCLLAYQHKVPNYIPTFFTDIGLFQACPEMERYCGNTEGVDYWGCHWTYESNIHAPVPTPNRYLFTDIADWKEKLRFPDLDAIDWENQAEVDIRTDFIAYVSGYGLVPRSDGTTCYDGDKAVVCMVINGIFERLHACMGFENALMALATDPESCKEFFKAMADWKIKYFKKIIKYYKVDIINAHDDYGTNDRLFMSPAMWREIIKPELKRMVDACHEEGVLYQHHSCGFIEPIFGDLVEIGVDAIDTLQACNTNLSELKKKYGDKITFCGGFDNMRVLDVPGVDSEAIKAEYRRVIDLLAPGGSYVVYPITGTLSFVPAMLEEHFQYGMSFYMNPANR